MKSNKHDVTLKQEAIKMIQDDCQRVIDISWKLGVHIKTLYRWFDKYKKDDKYAFTGKGNLKPADEEQRIS